MHGCVFLNCDGNTLRIPSPGDKSREADNLAMFEHVPQSSCARSLVLRGIALKKWGPPWSQGLCLEDGQMVLQCGLL